MVHLDHDAFLSELTKMYADTKTKGSVNITMKRGRQTQDCAEDNCLIRAYSGINSKKRKISTTVRILAIRIGATNPVCIPQISAKNAAKFQTSYGNILKVHLDGLKKRERKKKTRGCWRE